MVDTSAWIEALRPNGDEGVRSKVKLLVEDGVAVFCDLVLLELWNGARGGREQKYLAALQQELECLPTNDTVWRQARRLARVCRRSGLTIPATDLLIAACATHHRTALFHQDGHFDQIREIQVEAG